MALTANCSFAAASRSAATKALVAEFTTDLQGRFLRGKDWKERAASLLQRETWKFTYMRDNQDAAFRAMVQKALEKGTARLREQMKDIGSPELQGRSRRRRTQLPEWPSGPAHAGARGGMRRLVESFQRGYAELRKRTLVDTYTLGNAIMAIEALYAPPSEFGNLKMGTIDQPRKRTPSPRTSWCCRSGPTNCSPTSIRGSTPRTCSASTMRRRTGLRPLGEWIRPARPRRVCVASRSRRRSGLHHQPPARGAIAGGSRFTLDLVDYRTHARRQASPDEKWTVSRLPARTSGWNYKDPKSDGELFPVWGSMTCSGVGIAVSRRPCRMPPA